MKKICLLLSSVALLLACEKPNIESNSPTPTSKIQTQKEPVKEEPITSINDVNSGFRLAGVAKDGAPIILVHGFLGFGRDEMLGFNYWGGLTDLQEVLKSNGYPTFTASVGPVSSNYDRAVELYYQIKGGTVDYGKAHAGKYGHYQKVSKTYPGFYPQWDATHPVHLISHSMGGQTARALVALLEKGATAELSDAQHANLFNGNKNGWVKSVTTISSPNDGTTLTGVLGNLGLIDFIKNGVATIAGLAGITSTSIIYDFDLEQWGLKRNAGENFTSYQNRVLASSIWKDTKDIASWDLSPEGALDINSWIGNSSNTYYFSISNRATNTGLITGWEYPKVTMNPLLVPLSYPAVWPLPAGMGNYTQSGAGKVTTDKTWWANDGVVNVISMKGPKGTTTVNYTGQAPVKGTWYAKPILNGYDHLDIVGMTLFADLKPLYLGQAALVSSLPN